MPGAGLGGSVTSTGLIGIALAAASTWAFARERNERFRWLGIMLLIPSILMIVVGVLFASAILTSVGQMSLFFGTFSSEVNDQVNSEISRVILSFFFAGLIPALIGATLFACGTNQNVRGAIRRSKTLLQPKGDTMPSPTSLDAAPGEPNPVEASPVQANKPNGIVQGVQDRLRPLAQSARAKRTKDQLGQLTQSDTAQQMKARFNRFVRGPQQSDNDPSPTNDTITDRSLDDTPNADKPTS
ncbi:MAG: hypothetical protein ACOCX5_05550 [Chloroflexota bacterium]